MKNSLAGLRFFQVKLPYLLIFGAATGLLAYTAARANSVCMTHDESGSFTIWMDYPIFKCFFSPDCWNYANLHWLYVFLMKPAVWWFGDSELAIRLPSLLGHLVYLLFSFKLVKAWTGKPWLALAGFLLLNLNPFLLDFFALARGYGLAMTFLMVSLFYLGLYFQKGKTSAVWGIFGGASLAVLANFTLLNYYLCLLAVFGAFLFWKAYQKERNWQIPLVISASFTLLLFALSYIPIHTLQGKGEFEYGSGSFYATFESVVKTSLYGVKYMSMYHVEVFGGIFVLLLTAALLLAVKRFLKNPGEGKNLFFLAACLLPLLASLASIAQHYLLGSQYLVDRTALQFIPLAVVPVYLLFAHWLDGKRNWKWAVAPGLLAAFSLLHAVRAYQLQYTSEWYYDFQTRAVLEYLDKKVPPGTKVNFGLHWLFHPTAIYYFNREHYQFSDKPVYSKELRTDSLYDYYYIPSEDLEKVNPDYEVEQMFAGTGWLMRRKGFQGGPK